MRSEDGVDPPVSNTNILFSTQSLVDMITREWEEIEIYRKNEKWLEDIGKFDYLEN